MFSQFRISHVFRFISICDLFTDSPSHIPSNGRMYDDVEKDMGGGGRGLFKLLPRNFPRGNEEMRENPH
jgi:hypothetical protein